MTTPTSPGRSTDKTLVYAPLGDLHITDAEAHNYAALLAQLKAEGSQLLDFSYLPGDVANADQLAQYRLVTAALRPASIPVHLITGHHDLGPGGLAHFYAVPGVGSAAASQGVWEGNGISGIQLGPNLNAKSTS